MNFAVLPPEVTSAQMYTGAGSGPMLAAAASWAGLGDELGSAAESFSSLTSGLADGPWQGPASAAMAAVATQYAQWLNGSAAQAAGAAANANATAAIFEAARAATTHPAAVSANRSQLLSLVRSNLFGFNAPAIAAAEGAYESMWAQNVAALAGYHGAASAVAAQLAPWQQLPSAQATPATSFNPGFNPQTAAKVATKVQSDVGAFGMYADSQVTIIKGATATVINAPPAQIPQRVVQAVRVDFGAVVDIATHAAALPATVASDTISVLAGTDSPVSPPSSTPPP